MGLFGDRLGVIFGVVLGSFWGCLRIVLGSFGGHFKLIKGVRISISTNDKNGWPSASGRPRGFPRTSDGLNWMKSMLRTYF